MKDAKDKDETEILYELKSGEESSVKAFNLFWFNHRPPVDLMTKLDYALAGWNAAIEYIECHKDVKWLEDKPSTEITIKK